MFLNPRTLFLATLLVLVVAGLFILLGRNSEYESPSYEVLEQTDNIEIRRYAPTLLAEVEVAGPRKEAIQQGFRLLAAYIFGENEPQKNIQMTVPVNQIPEAGTRIEMTAPVTQSEAGADSLRWKVQFMMPGKYTPETVPRPLNPQIRHVQTEPRLFAVIRFSGSNRDQNLMKHQRQLEGYLQEQGWVAAGPPTYAFYNPPWTPPPFRRNEVLIPVTRQTP